VFQLFANRSVIRTVANDDHRRGPIHAAVTIVQYGDYLTQASRDAAAVVDELRRRWEDQLRSVYRHFPGGDVNSPSWRAAEAAEAAGAQARFWEMHACLLRHEGDVTDADLTDYATRLELDVDRFAQELADSVYAPIVRMQYEGALRSGVESAPAIFIDGRLHAAHALESLSASVARALLH
jgi:protein-disulfide isomerase